MGTKDHQPTTPQPHGGALLGRTHGARAFINSFADGGSPSPDTLPGKLFYTALAELLAFVREYQDREPNLLETIAATDLARCAVVCHLYAAHAFDRYDPSAEEPLPVLSAPHYSRHINAQGKALQRLAGLLGASTAKVNRALDLEALKRPAGKGAEDE
jgi:hypothetical protein